MTYNTYSYREMADIVRTIQIEVRERNPLFCNVYVSALETAALGLEELFENETPTTGKGPCSCGVCQECSWAERHA